MAFFKKYRIMLKLLLRGYSDSHQKEELFLHEALRHSESDDDFKDICRVLGKSGGLFGVPTLMAFAKDENQLKSVTAINTIVQIRERVKERHDPEMQDFFSPSFWLIRWIGTKERFISYTACITGILGNENLFEDKLLDEVGEKLMREIQVDIFPHNSFRELRLCTSGWEAKEDFIQILSEIQGDTLMQNVFSEGTIIKSPEAIYEENMIKMRCDYLLTRLKLDVDYQTFHYLLKVANRLNQPED
jgi:hypothetical protein